MRTIKRDIVGAFILSSDNKLLLGKSHKGGVYTGSWIVPGGGVDEGETKLDALKREVLEETGINITDAKVEQVEGALTGESEKTLRDTGERVLVDMSFYNFVIRLPKTSNEVITKTEDDFVEATWFSTDKLKGLTMSPPTVLTLQKLGYVNE
ncbi:hypothetical protein A3E76_02590 [Candidatus Saccharibacteria bacterium RIFCSPHIGHO2_12_FULL_44_22]|nr:MAG: hypothetical protein A3E76_02590 [Candidatus Saccharibacteria bacterium RIFCSPHIGHO2_12_FULL_44_22]